MSRECVLCQQVIQDDSYGLDVMVLGNKRKIHITCANIIRVALEDHNKKIERQEEPDSQPYP